jgi:hypothetical protein
VRRERSKSWRSTFKRCLAQLPPELNRPIGLAPSILATPMLINGVFLNRRNDFCSLMRLVACWCPQLSNCYSSSVTCLLLSTWTTHSDEDHCIHLTLFLLRPRQITLITRGPLLTLTLQPRYISTPQRTMTTLPQNVQMKRTTTQTITMTK